MDKIKQYSDIPQSARSFLSYVSSIKGKSDKTINEYYYDLRTFFRFMKCYRNISSFDEFESIDVSDINDEFISTIIIDELYEFMLFVNKSRSNSQTSRARKVSCLRSYFNYLTSKAHKINVNIAKDLESPKIPAKLPIYLTLEESRKLLENIDGEFKIRDYAIITLFLNCGMRLSELVGINLSDIKEDSIVVTGKGNKQRTIYLNHACQTALSEYMRIRPHDNVIDRNALFLSKQNKRISNNMVYRIVRKNLENAGLDTTKFSTHKLRHTAATLMYQHGNVDVRTLQAILGHEQLSTTQIYTHLNDDKLREAVNKNPLADINEK